jgi:adenylyltransferase/sulfurtransferase
MNNTDLLRYSRQIMLPQIDIEGQQILTNITILLVGLGGLGSISSIYLASSGIGHLIIADFDKVELSNLQRQIVHNTNDIDKYKVDSAKDKILKINPNVKVTTIKDLNQKNIDYWIDKSDIVLDGTDNFDTRFQINTACVKNKTPLVSAAVIRFEGQLSVFKGYKQDLPCYQCLYQPINDRQENCSTSGVMAPVVGMIGSLQALQAIKVILKLDEQLAGKLMLIDALDLTFRKVKISKNKTCEICKK